VLRRRQHRWVIGLYAVAALIFVAGNWKEAPDFRWIIAGVWYNDYFRISGMLPVAGIPVAALGGIALADRTMAAVAAHHAGLRRPAGALLTIAGLALAPLFAVERSIGDAAAKYRFTETSWLLTQDELALLERVPRHVPEDAVVVGKPLTGAALVYSYTGRQVLLPYGFTPRTPEARLIMERLSRLSEDPEVCAAIRAEDLEFVLDFGNSSVHPGKVSIVPGLQGLADARGFELVDSEGQARLYRITGCG
jgi:hypothetical protein